MFRVLLVTCGVLCLCVDASAQTPAPRQAVVPAAAPAAAHVAAAPAPTPNPDPAEPVVVRDDHGAVTVRATRIGEAVVLDGELKESIYSTAPYIDGFLQQEPKQGQPGSERTEVWLLYDDRNIYVSGRLFDSEPEREVVTEMRRDGQGNNDNESFGVIFDTFLDHRNGFLFQISLAGGLWDSYVTDERDNNRDWNTVWNARTHRNPEGWTFEMSIPFKSLRYPPGESQTWGVNLKRVVRWKNEVQYLTQIPAALGRRGFNKVSSGATLVGLEAPNVHRVFEIKPYAISGFTTQSPADAARSTDGRGDGGFDVKVGLTKGVTADVTYNTDFAQVEQDEQQANLTRFSVQFPEKREFFLEGSGIFAFGGVQLSQRGGGGGGSFNNPIPNDVPVMFFSRNIGLVSGTPVPIDVGGRVTGKAGRFSIGLIDIRTASQPSVGVDATNFGVVRVKRDIMRRSAVGVMYTDRSLSSFGNGAGRLAGVDGVFGFYDNLMFNTYFAVSENPGSSGRNTSYRTQMDYNADRYGLQIERLAVDQNFAPDIGFMRRSAFTRNSAYARFSPRPNRPWLRKYYLEGNYDYTTDPFGALQSRNAQFAYRAEFQTGDNFYVELADIYESLPNPFEIATGVTIPVGGYSFTEVRTSYFFAPQRPISTNLIFELGQFYGGRRTSLTINRTRLQFGPQMTVEPSLVINAVRMPYGDFTSKLVGSRITYTMTPRQSISGLVQFNSANSTVNTNIRYRWEYTPGSDFFVVLTDNRDTMPRGFPQLRDRSLIVKYTRLLRF
ncbi:MAG: DUF5916 domain-containing protein [Vicinamibacterales bacterium]